MVSNCSGLVTKVNMPYNYTQHSIPTAYSTHSLCFIHWHTRYKQRTESRGSRFWNSTPAASIRNFITRHQGWWTTTAHEQTHIFLLSLPYPWQTKEVSAHFWDQIASVRPMNFNAIKKKTNKVQAYWGKKNLLNAICTCKAATNCNNPIGFKLYHPLSRGDM